MIRDYLLVPFLAACMLIALNARSHAADEITPRHQRPGKAACAIVREFVAALGEAKAEAMARGHGATEAQIEAARKCRR